MIFASDLDRTLIFSEEFIKVNPTDANLVLADRSKISSFMDERVLGIIKGIVQRNRLKFIPVTNRSLEEYKRTIFYTEIKPEWAITTGGGKILHNGKVLTDWENRVSRRISEKQIYTIMSRIDELSVGSRKSKFVDGRYIFTKLDNVEKAKLNIMELKDEFQDFEFVIDKKKLYTFPGFINKAEALKYLMGMLGESKVVAAGDSDPDVCMLESADVCIIPLHNTIKNKDRLYKSCKCLIVVDGGVNSSYKILTYVMNSEH